MSDEPPHLDPPPAPDPAPLPPAGELTPAPDGSAVEAAPGPAAAEPPLLATAEPPLLPAAPAPDPAMVPPWLLVTTVAAGLLELGLAAAAASHDPKAGDIPYVIGLVLGGTVIWPLIAIGLFSLSPRYRTPRRRAWILLVVFGVSILGHAGNLAKLRRATQAAGAAEAKSETATEDEDDDSPPAAPADDLRVALPDEHPKVGHPDIDFSPGSDERLIKVIEATQEGRYHATVAAYADECAIRPNDAVLALERVRFVERFANSEENSIASAADDLRVATAYLTTRFPDAPGTVLYRLRNFQAPGFEAKAESYDGQVSRWGNADRAGFFLLRAQSAEGKKRYAAAERYAAKAFQANPTVDAGLVLARVAHLRHDDKECVRALLDPVFGTAEPWVKQQKMELLFEAGRRGEAIDLYRELKKTSPDLVNDEKTATQLAGAGQIAVAREIFAGLKINKWTWDRIGRARFDFEMQHGTAEQAAAAYRALRSVGIKADPFLHDRMTLFWAHPTLGWNGDDLGGALALLGMLLLLAGAPLAVLAPMHYAGLWRASRGRTAGLPGSPWGLRAAWVALAVVLVAEAFGVWFWQPELLRSWWRPNPEKIELAGGVLVPMQFVLWAALSVVTIVFYQRARAWRLMGPGTWSIGKSIGIGCGLALALRLALGIGVSIWPQIFRSAGAGLQPATTELCGELLGRYGLVGLIGAAAVFTPVLEEMLFRGVLLQAFAKHLPFAWANAVQAALFAALHETLVLSPFFFAFACINGVLARRAGGLLPAILLHALNNLVVCLVLAAARHTGH